MTSRQTAVRSLWLSWPIAVLGLAASLAGILLDKPYAKETANWEGQAIGQDLVNLLAYVALVAFATVARRGSARAYLLWAGVLTYSVYTYAIYAFSIQFGPLFLPYVAILGLSTYALIGALAALDVEAVKAMFERRAPVRPTAVLLLVIGSLFYLLWLSEILPATFAGEVPQSLREAGLTTNPVYVLDMALLLPAAIMSGVLLVRGRALGFALAPVLLTALILLALGIVAAMLVLGSRGEPAPIGVTLAIAAMAAIQLGFLVRFLAAATDPKRLPAGTEGAS